MSGQGGFIRAKVFVFGANNLHSGKVIVFGQKLLYLGNSCFIRESDCIRAKVVVLGQSGCVWAK